MIRRQFLPPEPANHPHTVTCEPVSQRAGTSANLRSARCAVAYNQTAHYRQEFNITRLQTIQFFRFARKGEQRATKTFDSSTPV